MKGLLRTTAGLGLGIALAVVATTSAADPMPARETARVLPAKGIAVGLSSPSAFGLGHGLEITTMVVPWLLISPNASVRAQLMKTSSGIVVTTEYGLAVPSGAMKVLQGYLFPSYATTEVSPPFIFQQHAGVWLSGGGRGVWTAHADVTTGLGGNADFRPLDSFAPFNLWFAPATSGSRWHLGGTYDYAMANKVRLRLGVHGYAIGQATTKDQSLGYFSADAALDFGLGKRIRLVLGAQWYNYDKHAVEDQKDDNGKWHKVHVRSNDIYPTLDFVFYSP